MQGDLDPHYSTVSDDSGKIAMFISTYSVLYINFLFYSDDMYTTIQDPNNAVYTSGSETYAQIQPPQLTVAAEINLNATSEVQREADELSDQMYERAPQPPSVDSLKHVTHTGHTHSRQGKLNDYKITHVETNVNLFIASSSSSVGNIGSPKPEKRQANSPLPPPPPSQVSPSPELLGVDKLPICKNLDDMYAKVQKTKKKNEKDDQDLLTGNENVQRTLFEEEKQCNKPDISVSNSEHNYETLRKLPRKSSDPGYEKLKPRDIEYTSEPGYDSINGPDSILSTDPGYEVLKHSSEPSLETDPNYEELRHRACSIAESSNCTKSENNGYSVVNKQSKHNSSSDEVKSKTSSSYESDPRDFSTDEPNYESMPSESMSEHNYAVLKSTGSESDPNYESVHHSDPNYESVKYLDVSLEEPPYEQLQDEDSSKSDSNLSHCKNAPNDSFLDVGPGYEKVKTEGKEQESKDSNDSADPGYETIKNEKETAENLNVQLESDYDGIVQV